MAQVVCTSASEGAQWAQAARDADNAKAHDCHRQQRCRRCFADSGVKLAMTAGAECADRFQISANMELEIGCNHTSQKPCQKTDVSLRSF